MADAHCAIMHQVNQYQQIESIIQYLGDHFQDQPNLDELARKAGLSPYHFQRGFKRWAGISRKQFLKCLTLEYAKSRLADDESVLEVFINSGLSGPSRLKAISA